MTLNDLFTIVYHGTVVAVVPLDSNPESDDQGMLVYRSYEAAEAACRAQADLHELSPMPQTMCLREFLDAVAEYEDAM